MASTWPTPTQLDGLDADVDIAGQQRRAAARGAGAGLPAERFGYLQQVMVEAPFRLIRRALPHMYAQGWGRVVNISSVHGLRASPFKAAYVSAKHGLEGLSKVVALEGAAARGDRQLHQPGVRAHPAGRGPDRRPGPPATASPRPR